MKKNIRKKLCSVTLALAMVMSLFTGLSFGAESTTYDAPTTPMSVDDNIITGTAHRSGSPALGFMGINATSGFGMINGGVVTDYANAITRPALGVWGTNLNDNPDPYYWNYFYNFYADANGLAKSDDALRNFDASNNPVQADTNLLEIYGNISTSLSTRPDIALGCASTGANQDTNGYDAQLETIHNFSADSEYYQEGDESYSPEMVQILNGNISGHISSLRELANAMDRVTAATGKVGRYGDPQVIVDNYEKYIYGTSAYILSKVADGTTAKKTVAIVQSVAEDGTYTLMGTRAYNASYRGVDRISEYVDLTCDNIADTSDKTSFTNEDLAAVDVVISVYSSDATTALKANLETQSTYNSKQILIENYPETLFGLVMNSYENAIGFGYFNAYAYSDVLGLDPVEFSAVFYKYIYHVSDLDNIRKVCAVNFAGKTLPEGSSNSLASDFDPASVEMKIAEGLKYIENNKAAFADTIVPADYTVDWTQGLGVAAKADQTITASGLSKTYAVADLADASKSFTVTAKAEGAVTFTKVSGASELSISEAGKVTVKKGTAAGTYSMEISIAAAETDSCKAAELTKTVKVTVKKDQTITVSGLSKSVRATTVADKSYSFTVSASAKGKVTFAKESGSSSLSISEAGKVTVKKGTKAGTYKMVVKVKAASTSTYAAATVTKTVKVVVLKTQTVSLSGLSKIVYASKLKTGSASFTVTPTAKGTVTFAKISGSAKLTISKSGKVTVKKGTGKGTYSMKISVKAAETATYASASKTATVKVTVK